MPRWTWRDKRTNGGPCIVIDIDGVIANAAHRQHYLDGRKKRWQDFFRACGDDTVIAEGTQYLNDAEPGTTRVLLTARPETIHDETVAWLTANKIAWDLLIMRSNRDHGPSPAMKRTAIHQLVADEFVPLLAVDDDRRNIKMFKEEGVPTAYLHSGYHEA